VTSLVQTRLDATITAATVSRGQAARRKQCCRVSVYVHFACIDTTCLTDYEKLS